MKAVVVYESLWGNTAAIAAAIAAGIGPEAQIFNTTQATAAAIVGADLIVAGAPILGFRLPTDQMRQNIATNPGRAPVAPDVSHPPLRSWLELLPHRQGGYAATFETRIWWSPGSAAMTIQKGLERAGYTPIAKAQRYIVLGAYGPLRAGELERARLWGTELARVMQSTVSYTRA